MRIAQSNGRLEAFVVFFKAEETKLITDFGHPVQRTGYAVDLPLPDGPAIKTE
jgi:hypothetical protein